MAAIVPELRLWALAWSPSLLQARLVARPSRATSDVPPTAGSSAWITPLWSATIAG
ncbi:MAG TPA: hypothetical protein VFC93_04630 [Chloroflexota bacterium]|nr:hypothetical protein [Chloroflexota bacterium]